MKRRKYIHSFAPPVPERRPSGEKPAAKLYTPDPEAVARLKAFFAEEQRRRAATAPAQKSSEVLANLLASQRERQEKLNAQKRHPQTPPEELIHWHVTYYQGGESLEELARRVGVPRKTLTRRFRELGLPVSPKIEERQWQPSDTTANQP